MSVRPISANRRLCLVVQAALLGGCGVVSPDIPRNWVTSDHLHTAVAPASVAGPTGQLQLIICYGPVLWTHAAVRLVHADGDVVYWDPGGRFGLGSDRYKRVRDVLHRPAPTLDELWNYRQLIGNHAMAVFEWDIGPRDVRQMQDVLVNGAANPSAPGAFDPDFNGGACSMAISYFLQQHTSGPLKLHDSFRYPHDMAAELFGHHPRRVVVYQEDQPHRVYIQVHAGSPQPLR